MWKSILNQYDSVFVAANIGLHSEDISNSSHVFTSNHGQYSLDPVPDHINSVFTDHDDAANYYFSMSSSSMLTSVNSLMGSAFYNSIGLVKYNDGLDDVIDAKVDKVSGKGLSANDYTSTEKTKLSGIATAATANDTDTNLKARTNHTGTQSADTIVDGTTNKAYTATEKTKLAGVASGATANDTDANLKARANHTGTQTASTISDFNAAAQNNVLGYEGTTLRNNIFPVFKNATVASGVAVYHLTDDGLSTGNALFPNGPIKDSLMLNFNDAANTYQASWAWSNSDKTVTVSANKYSTANILSGILGQTPANGAVPRLQVYGRG